MEIFVTAQTEESTVAIAHFHLPLDRQIGARADQCGGSAMLKAAITVAHCQCQEHVALHRCALGKLAAGWLEEGNLGFANLFQVGAQARHVQVRHIAGNGNLMRYAVRLETG